MSFLSELTVIRLLELLGTFAFAVSGIKLAAGKRIDWFGAYVIGLVTAIGGGTLRDLLLDTTPFWMLNVSYLVTTGVALLAALLLRERLFNLARTLFLFDAVGLGLFTVAGISKTLAMGWAPWVAIVMGTITGTVGGVLRDVLLNELPLLFRKDIYALACIAGGLVFFGCYQVQLLTPLAELIAVFTITLTRIIAVKYQAHLPLILDRHEAVADKTARAGDRKDGK